MIRSLSIFFALIFVSFGCNSSADYEQELFERAKIAVLEGRADDVSRLIEDNPQILHYTDPWDKSTLLHVACSRPNLGKMVRLLVKLGLSPNALDDVGRTPLHYFYIYGGLSETKRYMIQVGAEIDLRDRYNHTAAEYSKPGQGIGKSISTLEP